VEGSGACVHLCPQAELQQVAALRADRGNVHSQVKSLGEKYEKRPPTSMRGGKFFRGGEGNDVGIRMEKCLAS